MDLYISKILPLMVLPIGLAIECSLIALFLLARGKRRSSMVFVSFTVLILWVSSMPLVASNLLGKLERQYPAALLENIPDSECIIVLGGAVAPVKWPRLDVDLSDAADRVFKAASLYKAGKGKVIIVAGGNLPWSAYEQTEAQAIRILLERHGVPTSAILIEGESRNTRENALNTKVLVKQIACEKPLLVTSAAHMTRSLGTFRRVGLDVFPVSTDVRVVYPPVMSIFDFLPDIKALKMTNDAMHEWMGQKVYQWRGWS